MEKKLRSLFEFQRFEGNRELQSLIEETEKRSAQALSDDDLWMVNAAGVPDLPIFKSEEQGNKKEK